MSALAEVESKAMSLSERERADLACALLASLPAFLQDDDEGVAEALRREAEAELDPSCCIGQGETEKVIHPSASR